MPSMYRTITTDLEGVPYISDPTLPWADIEDLENIYIPDTGQPLYTSEDEQPGLGDPFADGSMQQEAIGTLVPIVAAVSIFGLMAFVMSRKPM